MRGLLVAVGLVGVIGACGASPTPLPYVTAGVELSNELAAPTAPAQALRVVSFNVNRGAEVPRLARQVLDDPHLRDADVFLVQEIESHPYEELTRTGRLAGALRMNYVYVPARGEGKHGGSHGLAVLSKYPLSDVRAIELPRYDMGFNTRRRIAVAARIEVSGRAVQLYDVHLDTRISASERIAQMKPILDDAAAHPKSIVVIGGDLNTNPFAWSTRVFPTGLSKQAAALDRAMRKAGYATPTTKSGPTQRAGIFDLRLDSLYLRGASATRTGVVRTVTASDHKPIWIDIALAPK